MVSLLYSLTYVCTVGLSLSINERKTSESFQKPIGRAMAPKREEDEGACANRDVMTGISAAPSGDHTNHGLFLILEATFSRPSAMIIARIFHRERLPNESLPFG